MGSILWGRLMLEEVCPLKLLQGLCQAWWSEVANYTKSFLFFFFPRIYSQVLDASILVYFILFSSFLFLMSDECYFENILFCLLLLVSSFLLNKISFKTLSLMPTGLPGQVLCQIVWFRFAKVDCFFLPVPSILLVYYYTKGVGCFVSFRIESIQRSSFFCFIVSFFLARSVSQFLCILFTSFFFLLLHDLNL